MNRLWLLDVDGVMADNSNRMKYLKDKDYDKFYDPLNVIEDTKIEQFEIIKDLINSYGWRNTEVALATGRPERLRKITHMWIGDNWPGLSCINKELCRFRKDHDYRPSAEVKQEMLINIIHSMPKEDWLEEIVIVDDDPTNVMAMQTAANALGFRANSIVFGTDRLDKISGCVQSTSPATEPDTDKSSQKSRRFAFRGLHNRHH